jgi:hypothetical protein
MEAVKDNFIINLGDTDSSDGDSDSGTNTEDVESLCLISFPYSAGKWTDVFGIERSVSSSRPVYPSLATSRGALIVTIGL